MNYKYLRRKSIWLPFGFTLLCLFGIISYLIVYCKPWTLMYGLFWFRYNGESINNEKQSNRTSQKHVTIYPTNLSSRFLVYFQCKCKREKYLKSTLTLRTLIVLICKNWQNAWLKGKREEQEPNLNFSYRENLTEKSGNLSRKRLDLRESVQGKTNALFCCFFTTSRLPNSTPSKFSSILK